MALRRSFDHLARPYELLERTLFGRNLERARFRFLPELCNARRVLLVGEGDGRVLERLLRVAPHCNIDVVDKSQGMIARAKRRIGADPRVAFHHTDVRSFESNARYDAVATLFFLDCFDEAALPGVVTRLAARLLPGGSFLYADFVGQGDSPRHTLWLSLLYLAFGAITDIEARRLADPTPLLRDAGLVVAQREEFARGLVTSQLWHKAREPR